MGIDVSDFEKMKARVQEIHTEPDKESKLHAEIRDFCNQQFPKWKYLQARSDKRSTIAVGSQDFSIFMPDCHVLLVECKTKTGKLSHAQSAWHKEMEMLNHKVYVVRDWASFKQAIQDEICRQHDLTWDREESK